MITQLQLKNFTVFTELAIDFSPGINIIIGENGTGTTQLFKADHYARVRSSLLQSQGRPEPLAACLAGRGCITRSKPSF